MTDSYTAVMTDKLKRSLEHLKAAGFLNETQATKLREFITTTSATPDYSYPDPTYTALATVGAIAVAYGFKT